MRTLVQRLLAAALDALVAAQSRLPAVLLAAMATLELPIWILVRVAGIHHIHALALSVLFVLLAVDRRVVPIRNHLAALVHTVYGRLREPDLGAVRQLNVIDLVVGVLANDARLNVVL